LPRSTPSFVGLAPSSRRSSAAARSASAKVGTRCELALRRELWRRGLRFRLHHPGLPGRPDIVFPKRQVVVFCDGDFWHGRNLEARMAKLARGHNAPYWTAKVLSNVTRDRYQTDALEALGWHVIRLWETDILGDIDRGATLVARALAHRSVRCGSRPKQGAARPKV
jgi:DNA mismatch endonuclease (patch repair protein)